NGPALRARPTERDAPHDRLIRDQKLENPKVVAAIPRHDRVQTLGLNERPREAVEDEAALGVALIETIAHDAEDEVVGDEGAGGDDRRSLAAELRPFGDRLAQHVARRDVRDLMLVREALCLRSFPTARRADEDDLQ